MQKPQETNVDAAEEDTTRGRNAPQRMHSAIVADEKDTRVRCAVRKLSSVQENDSSMWIADLILNGKKIPFKLDTGAEITAISKDTCKALGEPSLQTTDKQLFDPAEQRLS